MHPPPSTSKHAVKENFDCDFISVNQSFVVLWKTLYSTTGHMVHQEIQSFGMCFKRVIKIKVLENISMIDQNCIITIKEIILCI